MTTKTETDNVQSTIVVDSYVWIKFTSEEAFLLTDIAWYGAEAFLKRFKDTLGKSHIEQHEKAIVPLFNKLYNELQAHHGKLERVKKAINSAND